MTKLPCGAASRTMVPGATPPTRWLDRKPSGIALTVIVMVRWRRFAGRPGGRRQRVRPPAPAAVDQHTDADVLARLVVEARSPTPA